jgi:hypothetical protein
MLKRPARVVIEKQVVITRVVMVIEKLVVLFLLRELPVLYIYFSHKCKTVGRAS